MTPELSRLRSRIDERTAKVVVVGQGYVGLPLAMRAAEVGLPGRRLRHLAAPASTGSQRAVPTSRTSATTQLAGRAARGLPAVVRRRSISPTSTSRSSRCRRRCARARPTCRTSRRPARDLARSSRPARCVVLESTTYPGHHRRAAAPDPRGRRPALPRPTSSSATRPSASTPATPHGRSRARAKVVSGIDPNSLAVVEAFYGSLVDKIVPVALHRRGRAHQAAREHVPARQHRARQRARDVRAAISASTSGRRSTRRRPSRTASCASLPGRASAATASRSIRRISRGASNAQLGHRFRFVELANDVNRGMPDYVVGRVISMLNKEQALGQRLAHLDARARVQARHQRLARVAGDDDRRTAARARRRRARARRPRPRRRARSGPRSRASTARSRRSRPPTSCCCASTTPTCRTTTSPSTRRLVLDTRGRLRGHRFHAARRSSGNAHRRRDRVLLRRERRRVAPHGARRQVVGAGAVVRGRARGRVGRGVRRGNGPLHAPSRPRRLFHDGGRPVGIEPGRAARRGRPGRGRRPRGVPPRRLPHGRPRTRRTRRRRDLHQGAPPLPRSRRDARRDRLGVGGAATGGPVGVVRAQRDEPDVARGVRGTRAHVLAGRAQHVPHPRPLLRPGVRGVAGQHHHAWVPLPDPRHDRHAYSVPRPRRLRCSSRSRGYAPSPRTSGTWSRSARSSARN